MTWQRYAKLPGGKWLFSKAIRWAVPYSGSIGANIVELRAGYAKVALHDRRAIRNHLNSIHAVALMNLGELTSGLAFSFGLPKDARAIPIRLAIDFHKKARGTLTAECHCKPPDTNEECELIIDCPIADAAGDMVAKVEATWKVGPRK